MPGAVEKLGLDPGMVAELLPIILAFVQKKGGTGLDDLLQGAPARVLSRFDWPAQSAVAGF